MVKLTISVRGTCVKSIKSLKGRVGVTEKLFFMSTLVLSYSIAGLIIMVYLSAVVLSTIGFVGRLLFQWWYKF